MCVVVVESDVVARQASMYGNAFGQPTERARESAWRYGFAGAAATVVFEETWTSEKTADELLDEATAEAGT